MTTVYFVHQYSLLKKFLVENVHHAGRESWGSQETSRSLARNGSHLQGPAYKDSMKQAQLTGPYGLEAGTPARPPASHRGHFQACVFSAFLPQQLRAQSRREQANESVSLCLAPNTAGTQQAQSLVGFA